MAGRGGVDAARSLQGEPRALLEGARSKATVRLTVCCVRQGERYGPEYVRRLYAAVRRNITAGTEGRFVCFTDQPDELPDAIEMRALPEGVVGWWNKLYLFKAGLFDDGDRILYFALDTVILRPLDAIAAFAGAF